MPLRALITGNTGQDGILLSRLLIERGYRVMGFCRRSSIQYRADLRDLFKDSELFYGDLCNGLDIAEAVRVFQPDELYNLAAQSAPSVSWALPLETGDVSAMGALRVFEAVRRFKPDCRVYQASSSEMFGNVASWPQTERTPFAPVNPYAAAKAFAHMSAGIYRKSHNMFIACGILFNHESRYRSMRYLCQKVTYGAACALLGIADSSVVNEEGEPLVRNNRLALGRLDIERDWGAAVDYVEAMWRMLQAPEPDDYVIGTGVGRSVKDLCEVAYRHVGCDWRNHVYSDPRFFRPVETGRTVADSSKAQAELGWRASTSFEVLIGDMITAHVATLRSTTNRTGCERCS